MNTPLLCFQLRTNEIQGVTQLVCRHARVYISMYIDYTVVKHAHALEEERERGEGWGDGEIFLGKINSLFRAIFRGEVIVEVYRNELRRKRERKSKHDENHRSRAISRQRLFRLSLREKTRDKSAITPFQRSKQWKRLQIKRNLAIKRHLRLLLHRRRRRRRRAEAISFL